jgi:hypothetical protein
MSENNQEQNGLFEMLEESLPAFDSPGNSKNHENFSSSRYVFRSLLSLGH